MVRIRWGDLQPGRRDPNVRSLVVEGLRIAICQTHLGYFAMRDCCPHKTVPLTRWGLLTQPTEMLCTLHGCQFDLTTGERSLASGKGCPRDRMQLDFIRVSEDGDELVLEV